MRRWPSCRSFSPHGHVDPACFADDAPCLSRLERGHAFAQQTVADAAIRPVVERLMRVEAAFSIVAVADRNLGRYADLLLARLATPHLHRLAQIATDSSQKIGACR